MGTESFDAVYQNYFEAVYRYALSLSRNPQAAEEITQETFFRAMRSLDRFQGKSSLKSWLCAIARNLWISEQRKKKREEIQKQKDAYSAQLDRKIDGMLRMQRRRHH